jgi:hypothetical protein
MSIVVDLPGMMVCVEPGCEASMPVQMNLMSTGTLGFRPVDLETAKQWQVQIGAGLGGAYLCRCPIHKQAVLAARPKLVTPHGR